MTGKHANRDVVAVIGMAGRFPGASNTDKLWRNLCDGVESISFFNDEEITLNGAESLINKPNYIKAKGIISDPTIFDAEFFNISPRFAKILDPQNRIFLELAWTALEDAGYEPDNYNGLIGVFAGKSDSTYLSNIMNQYPDEKIKYDQFQLMIANEKDYLPTMVSYYLDLKGPSVNIQTACSTSLVAVCYAFDSLMTYQSDMALAGGVTIYLPQKSGYLYSQSSILSKDGHCRPFDADAQGAVFSNGGGVVVLKRLDEAIRDKDHIYAVISGAAINNDGTGGKMSFMAPSVDGQAAVITMAQESAGVHPETISYIETHGTATSLGDPIEIEALTQAFRSRTDKNGFCAIGSIKSNIGHLDTAAGIAGLIKTVLALKNKKLPPSINYKKPNTNIDFINSPFYVNSELRKWSAAQKHLCAGVSSFGVGGTNAHVVVEEAPVKNSRIINDKDQLIILSAKTSTALENATKNFTAYLKNHTDATLADIAYTLQVGRKQFNHRRFVVCKNKSEALAAFETCEPSSTANRYWNTSEQNIVFMFSGQGTQHINMGKELYQINPIFRNHIDNCSIVLKPIIGFDLRNVLYPENKDKEKANKKIKQTSISQPIIFAVESAIAKLWINLGVQPDAMIGHSIGEYVAAYLAGVFTLEEALDVLVTRGQLMEKQSGGSMLVISIPEKKANEYAINGLSLAVVNAPEQCVISGSILEIQELKKKLACEKKDGKLSAQYVELKNNGVFYSSIMEPIIEKFEKKVKSVSLKSPKIPYLSNVTGTWIKPEQAIDALYWTKHLRQTVMFSEGIKVLLEKPKKIFIEIGPGNTLCNLVMFQGEEFKKNGAIALPSLPNPRMQLHANKFFLKTIGRYWLEGGKIKFENLHSNIKPYRVALPTYPFEGKRHCFIGSSDNKIALISTKQNSMLDACKVYDQTKRKIISSNHLSTQTIENLDAPKKELEKALLNIWQEVLGIARIGINDDFFEIGGQSLMAAELFAKIEKNFGKNFPLATLYQAPTIKKMADVLKREDRKDLWTSLVPIQNHGSKIPIFLVHGAEGNILLYRTLAKHLGAEQPVYGLQAEGLDGKSQINPDFKYVATMYIEEIRKLQINGPYLLGGYCLGGTIAFEMAQQLIKQGEKIGLLAMIEIYNIHAMVWPQPIYIRFCNGFLNLWYHILNIVSAENNQKADFLKEKMSVQKRRLKIQMQIASNSLRRLWGSNTQLNYHHLRIHKEYDAAFEKYVPEKYPGKIDMFCPKKLLIGFNDNQTCGYGKIAEKGITLHTLPSYPRGSLVEPYVKTLAEKLKKCIDAAAS